jgi:tRNA A37 threonylcarbamoyladenosine dehydratase
METLARSRVIIFGIGGVGGAVAEGLARAGVGALDLVDHDTVSATNVNRQIAALHSTIGRTKAQVMAERVADINPACTVLAHRLLYLRDTKDAINLAEYDYVVDAVDTVTAKLLIISEAQAAGTPVISCMGTANKLDPTAFEVADIYKTSVCPLAKIVRKEARKRGLGGFQVVYSRGDALVPLQDEDDPERPAGRRSTPGSVSFVPPVAGFIVAGEVVKDLVFRA